MTTQDILEKMHIGHLSAMQEKAFKAVKETANDVVILSPTGSGKTLAYLLPLMTMLNPAKDDLQAVIIVPGRELARQSLEVARQMGTGIRAMALYGGHAAMDEHREMRKTQPQVVFATPGRFNDHADKGNLNPHTVRWVVIDEFDKCLAMGFQHEMAQVMRRLKGVEKRILLSATDSDEIPHFVRLESAIKVEQTQKETQVAERITSYVVRSEQADKLETLLQLLCHLGDDSAIVFLNYRDSVKRTADFLRKAGFAVAEYHGGMEQDEREEALYLFSNASAQVLVATDLASRGLDIEHVRNVIHYHMPLGQQEYTHRVGRTARWNAEGNTFFILGPGEKRPEYIDVPMDDCQLPDTTNPVPSPRMRTLYIGKGKKDKISRGDILGFLCKVGGLQKGEIGKINVFERFAYAAVEAGKASQTISLLTGQKIKGVRTVVELYGKK